MVNATNVIKPLVLRAFALTPKRWRSHIFQLRWRYRTLDRVLVLAARGIRDCDLTIQDGIGRGLRFNSGTSAASFVMGSSQGLEQVALKAIIHGRKTFYDVGANVGFFTVIAARLLGTKGAIFCFEPLPENFRQIRHNAELNGFTNIHIKEVALANFDGKASFWMSAEPTWGKLASTGKHPDKMAGEIEVPVRRLDSIIAEENLPAPDVIKIDVEGAEVEVLQGAASTLRRRRPALLIELHGTNHAVAEMLSRLDYKTMVISESIPITQAHWNASVVAIPKEAEWPKRLPAGASNEGELRGHA